MISIQAYRTIMGSFLGRANLSSVKVGEIKSPLNYNSKMKYVLGK